jgi:hypothetical protein
MKVKKLELCFIIDVYDITNKIYLFSFYIYHENKMKIDLLITEKAHAIVGHQIVKYTFRPQC